MPVGADTQRGPASLRRSVAVLVQALLDGPQDNAQRRVECRPSSLQKVAQSLWDRQRPLAHRQTREDVVSQVRCRLGHAPRVTRRAHITAFAGEGSTKKSCPQSSQRLSLLLKNVGTLLLFYRGKSNYLHTEGSKRLLTYK